MIFDSKKKDFTVSPYTGLTRASWLEAAEYLMEGAFRNISSCDDPMVLPRSEWEITYPRPNDSIYRKKAEEFEGLCRTFFIAAHLIHEDPEICIHGICLRDYYSARVLEACTPGTKGYVYSYDDLKDTVADPFAFFQQTVETAALVICLEETVAEIWDRYSKEEKDIIAAFLLSHAYGNTVPQNWRMFNMLDMAFLYKHGYPIDEGKMRDHARSILGRYASDGWYRDGHAFDYYSCWAFQLYSPIWCEWYGYEKEPAIAAEMERNSNALMKSYPDFFDREGHTNMWGRSIIYRNAATSAFPANLMFRNPAARPGLARRICSGSLLQFLTRDDFLVNGIPCIGFYGPFSPLVQSYSCAGSPFWLGKAFMCLHLPAEHPFWTEKEENGSWETLGENENKVTALDGPGLCVTDHGATGITELRTGKVWRVHDDIHGMWNYSRLEFNSAFPWEAGSVRDVESRMYVHTRETSGTVEHANVTFWGGYRDGVLYRRQYFDFDEKKELQFMTAIDLADIDLPCGILRVDRLNPFERPMKLTLGSYGFPDNGTEIREYEEEGTKVIFLQGSDHTGRPIIMAMGICAGWDGLQLIRSTGTNPDSRDSILIYAAAEQKAQYAYDPYVFVSYILTARDRKEFTHDELFPVKRIRFSDPQGCGGYGSVTIELAGGQTRIVDYTGMDGKLMF